MRNVEVYVDIGGLPRRAGTLFRYSRRGGEAVAFEYDKGWLADPEGFALEPTLPLGSGIFSPDAGRPMFGSLGDSAPDTWGRRLLQRAELRRSKGEENNDGKPIRILSEAEFLLGAPDKWRQGALRFRSMGCGEFESPEILEAPKLIELGRVLAMTGRILRDEESLDDLHTISALGASLGGAQPKASVVDNSGCLSIAKFPKPDDDYDTERWEAVALRLAGMAGVTVANHQLLNVGDHSVLLSRRFDRDRVGRIPFLSALSLLGLKDGERGSYSELAEAIIRFGGRARTDTIELYRRMVLNVLISNVDDHLRNQGFLRHGSEGWTLSPAYDLNPTPADVRAPILSTNIDLETGTCNVDLVLSVAELFDLKTIDARVIIKTVAQATRGWRAVAVSLGAKASEVRRMESAFEHERLTQALAL